MDIVAVVLIFVAVIVWQQHQHRLERKDLEDRLMAMCAPVALTQVKVAEESRPGRVTVLDDKRMAELDEEVRA